MISLIQQLKKKKKILNLFEVDISIRMYKLNFEYIDEMIDVE